jgi:hypothetical protein
VSRTVGRRLRVFGLIALTVLPGAGAPGVVAAADKRPQVVNFLAVCKVSHTAYDDPIVFPRKPGRSHHHTFFGNVSTNAFSTLATLRAAGTTCGRRAETAAYWVPTVFKNGREVRPLKAIAYYQVREFRVVHPYPAGLKVVAGNSAAVDPQPARSQASPRRRRFRRPVRAPRRRILARSGASASARASSCTSTSPTAGTVGGAIAPTIAATWPTARIGSAPPRIRSHCRS